MKRIVAHQRMENGGLLCARNAARIFVRSSQPCVGVHHSKIPRDRTYYEIWRLERRKTGWGFTEITHGMGINGYDHKTVRAAVAAVLFSALSHLSVFVEEPAESEVAA